VLIAQLPAGTTERFCPSATPEARMPSAFATFQARSHIRQPETRSASEAHGRLFEPPARPPPGMLRAGALGCLHRRCLRLAPLRLARPQLRSAPLRHDERRRHRGRWVYLRQKARHRPDNKLKALQPQRRGLDTGEANEALACADRAITAVGRPDYLRRLWGAATAAASPTIPRKIAAAAAAYGLQVERPGCLDDGSPPVQTAS